MVNPFREVNWQPGREERRRFAVSLLVGFPAVACLLLVAGRWQGAAWNFGPPLVVGGVGVALGLLLWIMPQIARPFYVGWYAVACCLGFVMGNGALALIYLFLLTPLGLVMRALGRRPLRLGFDRSTPSYWQGAPPPPDPERYYRQF